MTTEAKPGLDQPTKNVLGTDIIAGKPLDFMINIARVNGTAISLEPGMDPSITQGLSEGLRTRIQDGLQVSIGPDGKINYQLKSNP